MSKLPQVAIVRAVGVLANYGGFDSFCEIAQRGHELMQGLRRR
jgi:hypothetical protein